MKDYPSRSGSIQKSAANDASAAEAWEQFGVAMQAMRSTCRGTYALLGALEAGKIAAHARSNPPATGNEILDAAGSPSPEWWMRYNQHCADDALTPTSWSCWLSDYVQVQQASTLHIFTDDLDEEREYFRIRQRDVPQRDIWSDLEALAWFASEDDKLVLRLRDFGHQDRGLVEKARTRGLRYLSFQIALHHCRCDAQQSPLAMGASVACICVKSAWDKMVASLQSGQLAGCLSNVGSRPRRVEADEFAAASWLVGAGRFALLNEPGELLFRKSDVQSAAAFESVANGSASSSPSREQSGRGPGRPVGSGGHDDTEHLEAMHNWLQQNSGKTVRDAAKHVEPQANDRTAQVESVVRRLKKKYEKRFRSIANI